jgi:glutamate 5-kinase
MARNKKQIWVVKIGSSLLTNDGRGIDNKNITLWAEQIVKLKNKNIDIVLVSSGAIAEGVKRMKWKERPKDIHKLQAAAAIGQMGLIQSYETIFSKFKVHTAQILLTHDNLTNEFRYKNISSTLFNLLDFGVIPIVNENDTVAVEEIKFGDNDTLAALVANLLKANKLIILTDQGGIYDSDPRFNKDAKLINKIQVNDQKLIEVSSRSVGSFGSGGMRTKAIAAKTASKTKTITIIASGRQKNVLTMIGNGESTGTLINC